MFSMHKWTLALVAAIATVSLALAGCGGDDEGDKTATADECKTVEQPTAKEASLDKPTEELDPDKTYTVTFKTSCGDFTVTLDQENNPKTAASFKQLADEGVYSDTWFHRIIPDFVIQGGDPKGDGTGDAGYQVVEKPTGAYFTGTVAMAKGGADPSGASSSQFFVIIGAQGEALPSDYAIAGSVTEGMDTVERIAEFGDPADTTGTGTPQGVALIYSATSAEK
jgi:cyclophilin family peptidyl-prolyl cis-trans isomerase